MATPMTMRIDFRAFRDYNILPMEIGKRALAVILLLTAFAISGLSADGSELRISDFPPVKASVSGLSVSANVDHMYFDEGLFDYEFRLRPFAHTQDDTTELNLALALDCSHNSGDSEWERFDAGIFPSFGLRRYLLSSDFFVENGVAMWFYEFYRTDTRPHRWEGELTGNLNIGVGYGRVREGTYVAMALQVNNILRSHGVTESDLTRETILGIAQAIARQGFFHWLAHDRYHKYLLEAIENALNQDPACQGRVIPAYVWVKILEIVGDQAYYFYGTGQSDYWHRFFGSRFRVSLLASEISYREPSFQGGPLKLFDTLAYVPAVEVQYEFHWPRSLNTQFFLLPRYRVEFRRGERRHEARLESSYGYGIMDRLLLEGRVATWCRVTSGDTISTFTDLELCPEVRSTYYLEESIEFSLRAGNSFSVEWFEGQQDRDFYSNPFVSLSVDWRIL